MEIYIYVYKGTLVNGNNVILKSYSEVIENDDNYMLKYLGNDIICPKDLYKEIVLISKDTMSIVDTELKIKRKSYVVVNWNDAGERLVLCRVAGEFSYVPENSITEAFTGTVMTYATEKKAKTSIKNIYLKTSYGFLEPKVIEIEESYIQGVIKNE